MFKIILLFIYIIRVEEWTEVWQVKFNAEQFEVLQFTGKNENRQDKLERAQLGK